MVAYLFDLPRPSIAVEGHAEQYLVRRIYCMGRNYYSHAQEMGFTRREPPFFFMKPADAAFTPTKPVPYPPETSSFHYEGELVVAIGAPITNCSVGEALGNVYGYAVGVDMTRRDLQRQAAKEGKPWEIGKAFSWSAPCSAIRPAAKAFDGQPEGMLRLSINGEVKQEANLSEMIWNTAEIISELSKLDELRPGDLIFTGTPKGVGELRRGDALHLEIEKVGELDFRMAT